MRRQIRDITGKEKIRVVGLMSGTSADGVDAAIIEIDRGKVRLLAFDTFVYPAALRRQILNLCRPESARLDDICHYNFVLGEVFADAVIKLCSKSGISLGSIEASEFTVRRSIFGVGDQESDSDASLLSSDRACS